MIRFGVLGALQLTRDGEQLHVPTVKLRQLLALLLAQAGKGVSTDAIIDGLWDDRPPPTARRTVAAYVSRLRDLLGGEAEVESRPSGFAINVGAGQLDSAEFEGLIGPDAGPEKLGAAVALWRGPAYDGLRDVPALRNAAERLDDLKLSTVERLIDVRLEAGRHHEVIAELAGLIAANPFRERLRAQLMTALYRSGRQAEALEQYRAIYRLLADEFGVAPTHELSELHQRILNGDADLHAPAAPARLVPRTLPLDVTRFSGRQDALAWLDKEADDGAPVVISAVAGTAGVGKTALATRWAHSVAHRFPDGQLFLNLRGYGPGEPLEEMQALTELLRLAGMAPQQIPPEPRAAADLLRSVLASRRVLVVLDNARSAEQVRPLLPGGPGNRVLITSRDSLLGLVALEGARRLVLNVLPVHDAVALLRSIVGDRVEEDAAGSVRLAERCGCLPLALRIAAARLVDDPGLSIAAFAERLDSQARLAELAVAGDTRANVEAVFAASYRDLDEPQRRLFRLMGLLPSPEFSLDAVAGLANTSSREAAEQLRLLCDAHLVTVIDDDRFTMHDLLREYAASQAQVEDGPLACAEATERGLRWFVGRLKGATARLYPTVMALRDDDFDSAEVDDKSVATQWLDRERQMLAAVAEHAARHGHVKSTWAIGWYGKHHLFRQRWLPILAHLADFAEETAARTNDPLGRIVAAGIRMLINMGGESLDTALDNARQQATDARAIGWWEAEVDALNQSGMFNVLLGRLAEAESELRQALARLATESVNYRTSITLERLALACTLTGALCDAVEFAERGLATARAEGAAEFSMTVHLGAIAAASRLVGDQGRAEQAMAQALAAAREINAGHIEAILVTLWARLSRDGNGDLREALADCRRGRAVLDRSPDRRAACHAAMTEATLLAELGDFPQALSCLAAAETVAKETAGQLWGEWLLTAGIIRLGAGDLTGGDAAATEAIDHASAGGMRVYEAQARLVRAEALMRQGEVEAAGAEAERAQGMYAEMGHKLCPRPVSWLPNVMWP